MTKVIPGHPDYLADEDGAIYSTRYKGRVPKVGPPKPARRLLSSRPGAGDYLIVTVVVDGCMRERRVNRLVCAAFHGPPPTPKHEAQHRNGVQTNNRADNLKWGLPKENAEDRERHGHTARGSRQGHAKFTEAQVVEVRTRASRGEAQRALAREFGVTQGAISHIVVRRNWRAA